MGTTADKLNHLLETKDEIKAALILKGQSVPDSTPFSEYAEKIRSITTGVDTSDATAAAGDILSGKTAYVKGAKVTGNIASKGAVDLSASGASVTVPAGYYPSQVSKSVAAVDQATPTASIDKTTGKVTASATQGAGYVAAGTKSGTLQLTTQAAATITPGTAAKTAVAADRYTTGAVQVVGDANLVAGNIKKGVSVFGVTGTMESGTDTSDATATAGSILSGKTAYVKGNKVTGTIASQSAQTIIPGASDKTIASGKYLSGTQTIKGDANLTAENIKSGVSIFGVEGSYEGSGFGSSPVSVTINKVSGVTVQGAYPTSESTISQATLNPTTFTTYGAFVIYAAASKTINFNVKGGVYTDITTGMTVCLLILPTSSSVTVTLSVFSGGNLS